MTDLSRFFTALFLCGLILLLAIIGGCANYSNVKRITTTTEYPNGRIVTVSEFCETKLLSSREVKGGALKVSKNCAVTGGADEMTANEQQMLIFQELVKKIP